MKQTKTYALIISALGMALVFLATYLIKIPNGIQGYFNLGDGFLMLFGSFLNPWQAFLVGGVGSALADIVGGYGIYALPTLLIKGLEAWIIAYICQQRKALRLLSYFLAGAAMILGYFLADSLINESFWLGFSGMFANLLQALIGIAIACCAYPLLAKIWKNDK